MLPLCFCFVFGPPSPQAALDVCEDDWDTVGFPVGDEVFCAAAPFSFEVPLYASWTAIAHVRTGPDRGTDRRSPRMPSVSPPFALVVVVLSLCLFAAAWHHAFFFLLRHPPPTSRGLI